MQAVGHVVGVRLALGDLERGARRGGAGLEARRDLPPERLEPRLRVGAHDPVARRVGVDDVGPGAAVGDVALDHVPRHGLLPQHRDGRVRRHHGVEGVDTEPGAGRGVGLAPKVLHLEHVVGRRAHQGAVSGDARVRDEVKVHGVVLVGSSL
ncbi:hypothetical protein G7054_g7561 [Neopestalotiopsis clavispora]|nr:hypothetical protein G7054_g7561 [Neopestalotiopsis clavispora]